MSLSHSLTPFHLLCYGTGRPIRSQHIGVRLNFFLEKGCILQYLRNDNNSQFYRRLQFILRLYALRGPVVYVYSSYRPSARRGYLWFLAAAFGKLFIYSRSASLAGRAVSVGEIQSLHKLLCTVYTTRIFQTKNSTYLFWR